MKHILLTFIFVTASMSGCIGTDESNEKKEITILTYDSLGFSDKLFDGFETKTGIEVKIIRAGDAGGIYNYLLQTKDSPQVDIVLGLDNTYIQSAIDANLLEPIANNASTELFREDGEPIQLIDIALKDNLGFGVPYDHGYICLNYNSESIGGENQSNIPTSLWDLTLPEWNGKVAIPSPQSSSPGRGFLIGTTHYFDHDADQNTTYIDWWQQMRDNQVIITPGWSDSYEVHYSGGYGVWQDNHIGDADLTVSYCHSPGVEAWFADNNTISKPLDIPSYAFHQVEYVSIARGSDSGNLANEFISYLISKEVNKDMPVENWMYSVLQGENLPSEKGYEFHAIIPQDPVYMSRATINQNLTTWLNEWGTVFS